MAVIGTNTAANSAVRYLNTNSAEQSSSLSKLASGSRINKASDDASGLAISTRISSDVTALNQAATNASQGTSILQTADGGASNISDILQRMKSLASQSVSGTVTDSERTYLDAEFAQLSDEIDGIAEGTRYNGQSLLDGSGAFSNGMTVVVGSDAKVDTIDVKLDSLGTTSLNVTANAAEKATLIGNNTGYDASGGAVSFTISTPARAADATATPPITAAAASTASVSLSATGGSGTNGKYSAADLAAAINGTTGIGVTASVDADTGKLTLTGADTGVNLTITGDSGFDVGKLGFNDTTAVGRKAGDALSIATQESAQDAVGVIDKAIDKVSNARANIGALQSRFEFRSDTIATSVENLNSANSAIKDVDVAAESANSATAKVKVSAAVAAAAQANQMPQELLKLLQ